MTSFVFETVRQYQINSYSNVALEAQSHSGEWATFCRTPGTEDYIEDESFTPGDFIEMFDHKINKVKYIEISRILEAENKVIIYVLRLTFYAIQSMPFISSKAFRLMFPYESDQSESDQSQSNLSYVAVGKISIGYHDMDGKL